MSRTKKVTKSERQYSKANIAWETLNGSTTKIFVLGENEWIDAKTSSNYVHSIHGPAIVVETDTFGGGREVTEHPIDSPKIWAWISRMFAVGLPGNAYITSPTKLES